jgi:hypothetical protein
LTGDEWQFCCAIDFEEIWLPEGGMLQYHPRTIILTPKVIICTFWSQIGSPVIAALLPRTKFTGSYFSDDIVPKIVEGTRFDLTTLPRQLMPHLYNVNPHQTRESVKCLKEFRMGPMDHPPYSPDLAPSDSYLFGKLKGALTGQKFDSTE